MKATDLLDSMDCVHRSDLALIVDECDELESVDAQLQKFARRILRVETLHVDASGDSVIVHPIIVSVGLSEILNEQLGLDVDGPQSDAIRTFAEERGASVTDMKRRFVRALVIALELEAPSTAKEPLEERREEEPAPASDPLMDEFLGV